MHTSINIENLLAVKAGESMSQNQIVFIIDFIISLYGKCDL